MELSSSRQRSAVSEGMALGLITCGRDSLRWAKVGVDLSYQSAWRVWQYRGRFRQVDTDLRHGLDGIWVMTRVDRRKQSLSLYWDIDGREILIRPRPVWSDGRVDVQQAAEWIHGDVPPEGWCRLATNFLEGFEKCTQE